MKFHDEFFFKNMVINYIFKMPRFIAKPGHPYKYIYMDINI